MCSLPLVFPKSTDKQVSQSSVIAKPRSEAVVEKPEFTPSCCGQPAKWVEVTVNMQYFYCDKCKNEVSSVFASSGGVMIDSKSFDYIRRAAATAGLAALLPQGNVGAGANAGQTSPSSPTWVPHNGHRLDDSAILHTGDLVRYEPKGHMQPHPHMTIGRVYDVKKPTGLSGDTFYVGIVNDNGSFDGYSREWFKFVAPVTSQIISPPPPINHNSLCAGMYRRLTGEPIMDWINRVVCDQFKNIGMHAQNINLSISEFDEFERLAQLGSSWSGGPAKCLSYAGPSGYINIHKTTSVAPGFLETY